MMRICTEHWNDCKAAIESRGLKSLGKSAEQAFENLVQEADGVAPVTKEQFDPYMSMNNHWWGTALKLGGLYLMMVPRTDKPEENEGHYCPLCEMAAHMKGFDPKVEIPLVADQMRAWCIHENLLPPPS